MEQWRKDDEDAQTDRQTDGLAYTNQQVECNRGEVAVCNSHDSS